MRLAVIGTGYVGLVSGACFAHIGHTVTCIDVDAGKIAQLQQGRMPLHEQGLEDIVAAARDKGLLSFTTNTAAALAGAEVIFIAVGTPAAPGGGADLSHVLGAARSIARHLQQDVTVVVKSTVPVGGNERVLAVLREQLELRAEEDSESLIPRVTLASNPEFLREGVAVGDFMEPDRIVIGCNDGPDSVAARRMSQVYAPLAEHGVDLESVLLWTDLRSAELIKYASNAMLAARISFMNEIAAVAQACGADVEEVRRGLATDKRIGPAFLRAGIGYGGSCFPKDVRALAHTAREHGVAPRLLEAVHAVNESQKELLFARILAFYRDRQNGAAAPLAGRTVAVWGLAFKPGTDDMREAPSLPLVRALLQAGAQVRACDPAACDRARAALGDEAGLTLTEDPLEAVDGADVLALVTEWPEFEELTPAQLAAHLADKAVFDGRNMFDPVAVEAAGLHYFGVGRGAVLIAKPDRSAVEAALAA
jgi:UDPglucose 6-dehydrogenase